MDIRLKKLERLAAQGDVGAQEKLANEWGRLRYVPTLDHCIEMQKCGFISGHGQSAMQEGLRIWCRILRMLAETVHRHRRTAFINDPYAMSGITVMGGSVQKAIDAINEITKEIDEDINRLETETNFIKIEKLLQSSIYPYINSVLEFDYEEPRPPLYQMLSAFNDALHLAYMDNSPDNFHKLHLIFREKQGNLQTILEWNISNDFLDIPNVFRYQPRVWNHWGFGKCNNRTTRLTGGWDYNPLDDVNDEGWQLLV